jgi:cytoskeletal protein RodZ
MRHTRWLILVAVLALACGKQQAQEGKQEAKKVEQAEPAKAEATPEKAEPAAVEAAPVPEKAEPAAVEAAPAPEKAEPAAVEAAPAPKTDQTERTTATEPAADAGEEVAMPELAKVELPVFEYPEFTGKRLAVVLTANLIGELEPCG